MSCIYCKKFLSDFLETGIHRDLLLAKRIRHTSITKVLPELTDWMYRIYMMIPTHEFEKAIMTSSKIARRDRTQFEYEYVLHTATFNFLKLRLPYLSSEVDYITTVLLENRFLHSSRSSGSILYIYDYISYTMPRVILQLNGLHVDHEVPVFVSKSEFVETKEDEDDLYF